jgi:hypothetical protein
MSIPLLLTFSLALNSLSLQMQASWLKRPTPSTSQVQRTQAETQFIAAEFGVLILHKRLSRRDQLALQLTLLKGLED